MDIFEFLDQFFGSDAFTDPQVGQQSWPEGSQTFTREKKITEGSSTCEIYEQITTNDPALQAQLKEQGLYQIENRKPGERLPKPIPEEA